MQRSDLDTYETAITKRLADLTGKYFNKDHAPYWARHEMQSSFMIGCTVDAAAQRIKGLLDWTLIDE